MRGSPFVQTAALLAAIGALAGYATSLSLPRRYAGHTTLAFVHASWVPQSAYDEEARQIFRDASEKTLSPDSLTPIVMQSIYYRPALNYTPADELVEQIRKNSAMDSVRLPDKTDGFTIRFSDEDRYAALDMTRVLQVEMQRNAALLKHAARPDEFIRVVEPVRITTTGPGSGLCTLLGLCAGLALSAFVGIGLLFTSRHLLA
jgi:hypothetical protein